MATHPADTNGAVEVHALMEDLGPLAWVLEETRKSIESASKLLKRFAHESDAARGVEPVESDVSQLRLARQQLHQVVGALEMVGHSIAGRVARAMEAAVQQFVLQPERCDEANAAILERTGFALLEYLESQLGERPRPAVGLFPQFRQTQALAGAERIHPADLWPFIWIWVQPATPSAPEKIAYGKGVRHQLDQRVLKVMRGNDPNASAELSLICLGLAAGEAAHEPQIFWKLAAGFFEALGQSLISLDEYSRRAASRILLQYASLARGDHTVSEQLCLDLLFFCAQARPHDATSAPVLQAVRRAWSLDRHETVAYSAPLFGLFDPAVLSQARRRVEAVKENWSALAGGDMARLKGCVDQFGLAAESLIKLHPKGEPLAEALSLVATSIGQSVQPPGPELAMETATVILFLEASFADFRPSDPQLASRIVSLADRLKAVCRGERPQGLEPWMEELYRRFSERQTMGTVIGELRVTLEDVEKQLDMYFRQPAERTPLDPVPGLMTQMRGVLSVLGLEQAALAVGQMRQHIERLLAGPEEAEQARSDGAFERLGNSLGALGFLIDMLAYQPVLAKKLFVFDAPSGELRPLMGRTAADAQSPAPEPLVSDAAAAPETWPALQPAAHAAEASADAPFHAEVQDPDEQDEQEQDESQELDVAPTLDAFTVSGLSQSVEVSPPGIAVPVDESAQASTTSTVSSDDDLLDIFLEEAREVVGTGLSALEALQADAADLEQQTVLRRVFHTLKGSSRMVGLSEFGDAAWSMEQLFNAWLSEHRPVSRDLHEFSAEALQAFGRWTEDIGAGQAQQWEAAPFSLAADALRVQGQRLPLLLAADAGLAASEPTGAMGEWESSGVATETTHTEEALTEEAPAEETSTGDAELSTGFDQPTQPLDLEFLEFELDLDLEDGRASASAPSAEPEEVSFDLMALDFSDAAPPVADARDEFNEELEAEPDTASATQELADIDLLELDFAEFSAPEEHIAEIKAEFDTDINTEVDTQVRSDIHPEIQQEAEPGSDDAVEVDDTALALATEEFKQVGDLRISIPLYNVYLNEADEWSRRLATELSEWALELQSPVPEGAISSAHSLAGASATVGLTRLSELARAVEHALQRLQAQSAGSPNQAQVLNDAAEDIRRVLHQFAAGILKEPNASILQAVEALEPTDSLGAPSAAAPLGQELSLPEPEAFSVDAVSGAAPAPAASVIDVAMGDSIDVEDDVDADLLPIFTEEAEELLPRLATSIRHWVASPDDQEARGQVLRGLHTLKGSARLAGAMRLGEMAHRAESAIESLGTEGVMSTDLEPLLDRLDELETAFQKLVAADAPASAESGEDGSSADSHWPLQAPSHGLPEAEVGSTAKAPGEAASSAEPGTTETSETSGESPASREPITSSASDAWARSLPPTEVFAANGAPEIPTATGESGQTAGQPAAQPVTQPIQGPVAMPAELSLIGPRASTHHMVRVRSQLLDRLVNEAGEVITSRTRLEAHVGQLRNLLTDLGGNLERLRAQLRDVELQAETQMQSRLALSKDAQQNFDPLEFDRFTRMQELTRMMAESVNDIATVQRGLQRAVEGSEDDLAAQGRQSRELQRDLLRTRMVEFDAAAERLYRAVRQASKETGKRVRLEIVGGSIEVDRGILERMTSSFEHLLRNCVVHGIETGSVREARGKSPEGLVTVEVHHEGNDVSVEFRDDGGGLDVARIRERAQQVGLIDGDQALSDAELAHLIFGAGFTTAAEVTELAGRGIGMDVVRSEIQALGGRIETRSREGEGTSFRLIMPLTTAVTQVVMLRAGGLTVGVPSNMVETIERVDGDSLRQAYEGGTYRYSDQSMPFFWSGALLHSSRRSTEAPAQSSAIAILRSAEQRIAMHVDEVLGNQEVVVKNLGPQLSRLPGLVAATALASGAVMLIYNPVALATVYGEQARAFAADASQDGGPGDSLADEKAAESPLILVVDDSITVRRVTQRLLQREGYRVELAADGLQGLERLKAERPAVVLSDIEMPRMDGFDFVRAIRADDKLADLPVIMITSRIAAKHRQHAEQLGVNHYLGKPYSEDELIRLIQNYATAVTLSAE